MLKGGMKVGALKGPSCTLHSIGAFFVILSLPLPHVLSMLRIGASFQRIPKDSAGIDRVYRDRQEHMMFYGHI